MTRRECTATTKLGKACKATPRHDTGRCNAHSPKETRESAGFGGSQARAGRPALPKPADVARRLVEANVAAILRPHFRTLGYDVKLGPDGPSLVELPEGGAKLFGRSKIVPVSRERAGDVVRLLAVATVCHGSVHSLAAESPRRSGVAGDVAPGTPGTRPKPCPLTARLNSAEEVA